MNINADKLLENALQDGIKEGVKVQLGSGYNSAISKLIENAIKDNEAELRKILSDSLKACFDDTTFRNDIAVSVRHTLAKTLISRFGGELEKQVNVLKSDPATRARITLAIEEIVKERCTATV